jgi:phosphomevalonate kinase
MSQIVASAPGKLVLSGEYAVLDGAPAICMAVDRRAIATISAHDGEHHVVTAPGFSDSRGVFASDSGELSWVSGGEDFELFRQVWSAAGMSSSGSLAITLDTRAFHDVESSTKIGVGSSAALTVALATALSALCGYDNADVARRAHREFQGGTGSGVDIACSLVGGVVEYRIDDTASRNLLWPADLHYAVFWSGVAADTRSKLEHLQTQAGTSARRDLGDASECFAAAFRNGAVAAIIKELGRYNEVLHDFDAAHGLGIFDAGHAALTAAAASHGVVYKPCGAGGGDIGIALAAVADSLASFADFATASGFRQLCVSPDPRGAVLIEEEQQ